MEKETTTDETLLVHDTKDNTVKAVKGIDKQGNLQTLPPKKEHQSEFLKIDKHGDPFGNFLSNFKRQLKEPTRFNFFPVRIPLIEKTAAALRKKIKEKTAVVQQPLNNQPITNPQKQQSMETKKQTSTTTVENTPTSEKEQNYRFDPEKIDWDSLKKFGITKENLTEKTLDTLLKGNKSEELHRITADFGNVKLQTQARLSFRNQPDGSVALAIHGVRKQPELEKEFFGYKFTDEDKKNLLETGNMGRLAETKDYKTNEPQLVYISVDKLTNELVALKAERLRLPEEIKGVTLNDQQKVDLQEGKAIYVEGMTSSKGKPFSAYIQVNADKRGLEFRFENLPKQEQSQNHDQKVFIPNKMGGVEITKEQQSDLQSGKTIYVENMTDKKGVQYSAYVKVNAEEGKLAFYAKNPDIAQKEGKTQSIKPDNQHKAQVNANNEGKKSEANKKANEPFKKGETQKPKGQKL